VAYQTIKKSYKTLNGTAYDLQYDTSNGQVQLIQQGAPPGTQPIFLNGKFNSTLATQIGLTTQDQQSIYSGIQQEVKNAYTQGGGKSNNLTIAQWAVNGNDGKPPGSATTPAAAPSPTSGSSGGSVVEGLWGAITNPGEAIKAISITNGNWGPTNEFELFKGTIKYPIDMKTQYQDHVSITQYRYVPPLSDKLLSGDYKDIIQNGLQKTSNFNKEQIIGTVYLPMPNSLADKMDIGWGPDNMNNLTAAVMSDVIKDPKKYAGAAGLGALVSKFLTGGSLGGGAQTGATAMGALTVLTAGAGTQQGKALVGATVSSKLLQLAQFGVDVDSILARTAGVVPNNNLELMFGSPNLRGFSLSYKMTARDSQEAQTIRKILRFFKQGSAPKKQTGGAGQASYFLGTPNVFRINFMNGVSKNKAVSMYKTLALTSIQTNYTAAGPMWASYDDGQPVAVTLDLSFVELEPIFDTDYQTDVFANTGLEKVENDAVGY